MTVPDCFQILGLPKNACLNDLKMAYRRKAKKYHPDRNGGDERQFSRLHEAYALLLEHQSFQSLAYEVSPDSSARETNNTKHYRAYKKSPEEKTPREANKRFSRDKANRKAEEKRAEEIGRRKMERKASQRKTAFEEKSRKEQFKRERERNRREVREKDQREEKNSFSRRVFAAGEIISGDHSDRKKIQAIHTLISLKRRSAYPFLKEALNKDSEKVVLASIEAIGELKILQAGPELGSLMSSDSVKIRRAVINTLELIGRKNQYTDILNMALKDKDSLIRQKADSLYKRIYG